MVKVSICIPEYNAEKYIDRNLNSILCQTYSNIEIVLYDDASTDNTRQIMLQYAKKYPDKIRIFYSDTNRGIGAAKNAALAQATGEYVFFCDCDDYLKPNCIECLVSKVEASSYPDLVIDGFTRVTPEGNMLYERKYKDEKEALLQSIPLFAKLIRRKFLTDNQIWSPEGVILEDVLYQAQIVPRNPSVEKVDNCGYYWVKNLTSASHTRLTGFKQNALENGLDYLLSIKNTLPLSQRKHLTCFVMQFISWHLLKSGCKVGKTQMMQEYRKAKSFLDQNFPEYKKINYVSVTQPKGMRSVVRCTIWSFAFLMKTHMIAPFLCLYASVDMSKLWPKL